MVGWIRDAEPMATDLFVESIPFLETRRYVKQMAENVVAYDIIYGGKSLLEASKSINSTLSLGSDPGLSFDDGKCALVRRVNVERFMS